MINIIEAKPTKLSGISSLYISFNFKSEIVNIIKTCSKYIYDKNTYTWELPLTELSYLLDELTYIDDIKLTLLEDNNQKEHFYPKCTSLYKSKPFQHQLEAIEWGLNNDSGLILDDPGLGKSLEIIYLAQELKEQKGLEHCLIICGINTLKGNWKNEITKHSDLTCKVIGEKINKKGNIIYTSMKERAEELRNKNDAFFYIINIESLRNDDIIEAIKHSENNINMIVFDECHKCSNPSSIQSKGLLKLTSAQHKYGLTGTLLTNTPLNAFVPLKWIGTENSTLTNFKGLYCIYGGFGGHQIVGYQNIDLLKQEIDSCSIRRTKDILKDLPPKIVIQERVDMSDSHKAFYDSVKDGVKEECDKIQLNASNSLGLTVRLLQATSCPQILTTNPIQSTKIERACELVEEICGKGEKVVIMSRFKEPIFELEKLLTKYKPLRGDGDISDDQFNKNVKLFQEDNKHLVFLGTHQRAGTGITLNKASYMILIDCPWTAAVTKQVEDRIHRIGSKSTVFIYRLICRGTIDEFVQKAIQRKEAIADFIIDDKTDEKTMNILKDYIQSL